MNQDGKLYLSIRVNRDTQSPPQVVFTHVTVREWGTDKTRFEQEFPKASIRAWAFSPDSAFLLLAMGGSSVVTDAEGKVSLWDLTTGQERTLFMGHSKLVVAAGFTPDGRTLATASVDGTVKLWDPTTGQERLTLRHEAGIPTSLAFTADGQNLIVSWSRARNYPGWVMTIYPTAPQEDQRSDLHDAR
ncbi:MAG TPA: hypothetical protein VKU02_13120 [Gemmataceae bacterium]|nr:hypothetical protein [Gemmataceae bacterium]